MAPTIQSLGLDHLDLEERLALADALWESVEKGIEDQELTERQVAEIERRLADSQANPARTTPWETIRDRAIARARANP